MKIINSFGKAKETLWSKYNPNHFLEFVFREDIELVLKFDDKRDERTTDF
jgi:hypothetical protein